MVLSSDERWGSRPGGAASLPASRVMVRSLTSNCTMATKIEKNKPSQAARIANPVASKRTTGAPTIGLEAPRKKEQILFECWDSMLSVRRYQCYVPGRQSREPSLPRRTRISEAGDYWGLPSRCIARPETTCEWDRTRRRHRPQFRSHMKTLVGFRGGIRPPTAPAKQPERYR